MRHGGESPYLQLSRGLATHWSRVNEGRPGHSRRRRAAPLRHPLDEEHQVPHFQLVTTNGDALGAFELWDWSEGSIVWRGNAANLRVVERIDADHPEHFDVLVVEEA